MSTRRKNFHDQVVDELGRQIGSGLLAPGAPILTEPLLAEQLGVSRIVVREAIKALAAKGMVSVRPRTGTRVLPRERWNLLDPQVLEWHSGQGLDSSFVADLMELRRIVEPPAARLAAERAEASDLAAVAEAFREMEAAVAGRGDYVTADLKFHGAILAACHNQFIQQMQGALSQILKTSFVISSRAPNANALSLPLHKKLLRAIERRDGNATAAAAEALIDRAGENLQAAIAEMPAAAGGEA
jgi:GntR family galactonate operon transcriptional repressor